MSIDKVIFEKCFRACNGYILSVLPQSKYPNGKWSGIKYDYNNLEIIWEHIKKYNCNYGIQTGAGSGLDVLDVDRPELYPEHLDWLKRYTVYTTTGKGFHFWLKHNTSVVNRVKVFEGIDIRSSGGYVVAPGSIHENGNMYELNGDLQNAAEWPEFLLNSILKNTKRTLIRQRDEETDEDDYFTEIGEDHLLAIVRKQSTKVRFAREGTRNNTLFKVSCFLGSISHYGLSREDAERQLTWAARDAGLGDCEILRTFNSGWNTGSRRSYYLKQR